MISSSETVYYGAFAILVVALLVAYIRTKANEGTVVTTPEFQLFQTSYLTASALVVLAEILTIASFYPTFTSSAFSSFDEINAANPNSIEFVTKLYVVTIISSTCFGALYEIFDIGHRKRKCLLAVALYAVSMLSILTGSHEDGLLLGRIVYGAATALHHDNSAFDSYLITEHTARGFPDDWLTNSFSSLTHLFAAVAVVAALAGETAAVTGDFGSTWLSLSLFLAAAAYIAVVWQQDTFTGTRFNLSPFLQSLNQTAQAIRTNQQLLLVLGISTCCESAITVITFYWAPFLHRLYLTDSNNNNNGSGESTVPYELLYATFIVATMLGNYLYQLYQQQQQQDVNILQTVLSSAAAALLLSSVFQTQTLALSSLLLLQLCVGGYWPSIGALRGRVVVPEMRGAFMTINRVLVTTVASLVLTSIHHNAFLTLSSCSLLLLGAVYCQSQLNPHLDDLTSSSFALSGKHNNDDDDYADDDDA